MDYRDRRKREYEENEDKRRELRKGMVNGVKELAHSVWSCGKKTVDATMPCSLLSTICFGLIQARQFY